MSVKAYIPQKIFSKPNGFTLLELIVVLAGLGILSSLAIPNYMKYLDYAKVDEAKALLNNTAADCLQGLRRDSTSLDKPVNNNIISMVRLKNTGYVFKDGSDRVSNDDYLPNCRNVQIIALSDDDRAKRLPDLGFFLNDEFSLTKTASDSGSETKFPAESWAGANTTEEEALNEWLKLNEEIAQAKAKCKEDLDSFNTGQTFTWDSEKTKSCTDKPPISDTPETCTPIGCTKEVWYIDGEFCGYEQDDFRECQREKTSAACQAEKDSKTNESPPWTTATIAGDLLPNCDEPTWFFEGQDVGSAESWTRRMCDKNKKDLLGTIHSGPIEHCEVSPIYIIGGEEVLPHPASRDDAKTEFEKRLADNKDAQCTQALNEDASGRTGGPHTSPTPNGMSAPIGKDCNIQYWYCVDKIYKEEAQYKNDERCQIKICDPPPYETCYEPRNHDLGPCEEHSRCKGWIK